MPDPTAFAILGMSLVLFVDVSRRRVRVRASPKWALGDSLFRLI
jgi:hypothetical protein